MKALPFKMCQRTRLEKWRAETFWTKEPETIAWIDTFRPGDVLIDVGANVGVYTLYAAFRGCRVIAVEPLLANRYALGLNVVANKLAHLVTIVRGCAADRNGAVLWQPAGNEAGETGGKICPIGDQFPAFTVDSLAAVHGCDHVKIDVDGDEGKVLAGMGRMLTDRAIRSCLIEADSANIPKTITTFERHGYFLGPVNWVEPHSRTRRAQEGIKVENLIFCRAT